MAAYALPVDLHRVCGCVVASVLVLDDMFSIDGGMSAATNGFWPSLWVELCRYVV